MIKITPYKVPFYNKSNMNKKDNISFSSSQIAASLNPPIDFALLNVSAASFLWIKDSNLLSAMNSLGQLKFEEDDVKHVQSMGAVLPFLSGKEAVKFIKDSNIRVKFAELSSVNIHAQYDYDSNYILINNIYKNTKNPAEILAISEAILHEAGHAKDYDGVSTVQEEIDCLSMNAISHRALLKKHPRVFENQNSLIINDGVCVYSSLFFDEDPAKNALVARLKLKYGHLPSGDFKHPPTPLAFKVKDV